MFDFAQASTDGLPPHVRRLPPSVTFVNIIVRRSDPSSTWTDGRVDHSRAAFPIRRGLILPISSPIGPFLKYGIFKYRYVTLYRYVML